MWSFPAHNLFCKARIRISEDRRHCLNCQTDDEGIAFKLMQQDRNPLVSPISLNSPVDLRNSPLCSTPYVALGGQWQGVEVDDALQLSEALEIYRQEWVGASQPLAATHDRFMQMN